MWRQWRWLSLMTSAMRQGLDWQQVESVLRLKRIGKKQWPGIFEGLDAMQDEALEALSRQ